MVHRSVPERISKRLFLFLFTMSILLCGIPGSIRSQQVIVGHDKASVQHEEHMSHDAQIGERLFYGLANFESGKSDCEGCHSISSNPEINWNPSAYDLALWIETKADGPVKQAFESPGSELMEKGHKNIKLTDAEIAKLRAYLAVVKIGGPVAHKDFPTKLVLFFVFGVLMALALIDLIFTRKVKYRVIHVVILLAGLGFHLQMAIKEGQNLGRTKDYAPDQPIKFSHKVHAGDNKIDCKYCHSGVLNGKSAGLPSANLCLNCHNVVRNGRSSGKFEINKINEYINAKKNIEWVLIHKLPDHAYFNHAQHVAVGKVACETCHGPVAEMEIMKQHSDLSMGWCVNCHRTTKVNFEDNDYYKSYTKLHEELKSGKIKQVNVEQIGGLDCMKCHY